MEKSHLKSMTAYGRGRASCTYGQFIAEIQSVNHRFLEVNLTLPRLFLSFESEVRKQIAAAIGRGALNVFISWKAEGRETVSIIPNLSLARALKKAWASIAQELEIEEPLSLFSLAQEKDLLIYTEEMPDEEEHKAALKAAVTQALEELLKMKQAEGALLAKDLAARILKLHQLLSIIEAHAGESTEKYRQKLQERLKEFFVGSVEGEERLLREIALYADKVDITEEIVRFKSHLHQFTQLLEKAVEHALETRGKTADFLLQELLREINTIGSKAADTTISHQVVLIKSELEKMKEQVQNFE